jgi:hypothetical protein
VNSVSEKNTMKKDGKQKIQTGKQKVPGVASGPVRQRLSRATREFIRDCLNCSVIGRQRGLASQLPGQHAEMLAQRALYSLDEQRVAQAS